MLLRKIRTTFCSLKKDRQCFYFLYNFYTLGMKSVKPVPVRQNHPEPHVSRKKKGRNKGKSNL